MNARGISLVEVIAATSVLSVAVAGTMSAFVTASRIQYTENSPAFGEVRGYVEEFIESRKNHIGADDPWFANRVGAPAVPVVPAWPTFPGARDDDPAISGGVLKRRYTVARVDCDRNGAPDPACFRMTVRVCWQNAANCP